MPFKLTELVKEKNSNSNNYYKNMHSKSFIDSFKSGFNQYVDQLRQTDQVNYGHLQPVDFSTLDLDNVKSFTDPTTVAGGGNLTIQVPSSLQTSQLAGGAFIRSGINYQTNVRGSVKLNGLVNADRYQLQVCGTPINNEGSLFTGSTITPQPHALKITGCEDLLSLTPDPNLLLAQFSEFLEVEKLVKADDLVANAIIDHPGTVALATINDDPTTASNNLILAMNKAIATIGKWQVGSVRPKFYFNHSGFAYYLNQRDANGRFQHSTYQYVSASNDEAIPASGLVGRHGGYEIHLVGSDGVTGIRDTYTVTASNVVNAKTGGTNTLFLFGFPLAVTLLRGPAEFDFVRVFDSNDFTMFDNGRTVLGARTYMNAGVSMPARWAYYAFPA